MKLVPPLLVSLLVAGAPVRADSIAHTACQTDPDFMEWDGSNSELPLGAFRLEVLPDSGRAPGNFAVTIEKRATATIELLRPTRACRLRLTVDDCPAIADVVDAVERLRISVGENHAAELDRIVLHGTTYRLQVSGNYLQRHSISYHGDADNPIYELSQTARERLEACVPQSIRDFVNPPATPRPYSYNP